MEESVTRNDVVFSPVNTHHMSFQTSIESGTTTLKRPNPFGFASMDGFGAVGRCSPKRFVFPFDTSCYDRLATFPGNVPLNSVVVEDAVHRLRITEQTVRSRKKKSRRTPKVKKIKFHEYTGPNRRTTAQKSKSTNTGTTCGEPVARNAKTAPKLASTEVPATQQHPDKQMQKGRNLPTTLNLNTPLLQPPERSSIPPFTEPLRVPNLFQQINPTQSVQMPCTTTANASVSLVITSLQSPKAKESICSIKLPPNTPPVAKAGTSAPLLVPIVVRRKDPLVVCGSGANPNGVDRKTCRRDAVVVENLCSLDDLKVTELKEECKKRKLSVTGPKPRLLSRLLPFADDILNERNLLPSSQSKSANASHPKHNEDFKQDSTDTRSLPVRAPDFPSQQTVQMPTIHSVHLKTNSVAESRYSSEIAGVAAYTCPATTVSSSLCNLNSPTTCRPQFTDLSTSIGYPQKQKKLGSGTLSCYDFPSKEQDLFEDDVLLALCKEMSEIPASKLKSNGTLSDEQKLSVLSMGSVGQGLVNLSPFHEATHAESLCCKVPQQQFLTPPATPTLQSNGCVTCSSETPSSRGAEIEPVNPGLCPGLSPIALRGIGCKLSPKTMTTTTMMPLTGAELWMLQEKQIAELHLQLQKSKAELSHARMKVCLQQQLSGDHVTPGIAVGKTTDVLDSLISLAQSQVSPRTETGVIPTVYDALGKNLETTPEKEADQAAKSGNVLPNCGSQSGTTGSVAQQVPVVPEGADISGNSLLEEVPPQPETQGRTIEELPLQCRK